MKVGFLRFAVHCRVTSVIASNPVKCNKQGRAETGMQLVRLGLLRKF